MIDRTTDHDVPRLIYGTAWKEEQTRELTGLALERGFRGIDTANQRKHYHEAGVGEAIQEIIEEGEIDREDLFIQTKFTYPAGQDHRLPYDPEAEHRDQVVQSLDSSLEHLGTDSVDSLILHGPSTRSGLGEADREVWRTMEELAGTDRVGTIGISNVLPEQLTALLEWAERPPAYVQNRCFARTGWDREIRSICSETGIRYQGFSLLTANQRELRVDELQEIARRHRKTVPQIIFRFALQVDMLALTGTTSKQHMDEDLACFEFELGDGEVRTIEQIATR